MRYLAALMIALGVAACEGGTDPGEGGRVSIRFGVPKQQLSRTGQASLISNLPSQSVTVVRGANTLVINEVKMTLEDIDLERDDVSTDIPGPVLVRLNLAGDGLGTPLPIEVDAGTYREISFDISVPDGGDPAQRAYLAANPEMRGVSIRINGTFNAHPFSFALDLTGDQDIRIHPPLTVKDGQVGLDVAVRFDVSSWFVRPNGTLMDPRAICSEDEGCADRTTVEANIERTIESSWDD